eukprot:5711668-Ditylum_brightwellii.AAC.1
MHSKTYSTAAELVFEFTPPVGTCEGERTTLAWWGSLGDENSPVGKWEGVAINDPWTALTNIINEDKYNNLLKEIDEGGSHVPVGGIDDEILITGQPTGLAME